MTPERTEPPEGGPGKRLAGSTFKRNYNPLATAAATTLAREISVILLAADRMAAGHGLGFDDYSRLHQAHQHVLRVLASLNGREVLT